MENNSAFFFNVENKIYFQHYYIKKNETREPIARSRILASKSFRIAVVN